MFNCPVRWYTAVDEMSVDEMLVDEMSVDELSWNRETVLTRGTHNREGHMLFNGRASMGYHKITSRGKGKRLSATGDRNQDEELQ